MKKKILILHDTLDGGGAEKSLLEVLHHLPPESYDIDFILYLKRGVHLESVPSHIPIKSIYPKGEKHLFEKVIFHSPFREKYEAHKLHKLISCSHYDAIISFMEGPAAALHRYVMNLTQNNITWVHIDFTGCHWSKQFFRNLANEKKFYESVNHIVFVSKDTMNKFIYDVPTPRHLIYNMVNTEEIIKNADKFQVEKRNFTVSFIGRLVPHKHPERLLHAIEILKRNGTTVDGWILGQGELKEKLQTTAKELGISNQITFWGFQNNPYPFIKASDILCITSDAEGLPIVVQESMTLGTAIISTRCAGMTEAIGDDCGILCDNNPESFAEEISRLISSPQLKERIFENAKKKMEMFSTPVITRQIESLINNH